MSNLKNKLESKGITGEQSKGPLWKGPRDSSNMGGITFSALSRFLTCRERFRLRMIEGICPVARFDHKLEFGNMWHVCEENLDNKEKDWDYCLLEYAKKLSMKYPMDREDLDHWYNLVMIMFPLYIQHWKAHPDMKGRIPLMQEQVFHVPYNLPSGRTAWLKGKWDSVDVATVNNITGVWIQENKTKGRIQEDRIERQLTMDLQTMIYVVVYKSWQQLNDYGEPVRFPMAVETPLAGVRYNVIKRPGQYQGKKETKSQFHNRFRDIVVNNPGDFFMRWNVRISKDDVYRFFHRVLDPLLEQLCDWYDWVKDNKDPFDPIHWQHPFGVYNVLDEGGSTDLDQYLIDGSMVGLTRTNELFSELQ